jgi:hypothetical protein
VLVVPDELALRVGGEGGLARAGEPEEERDVASSLSPTLAEQCIGITSWAVGRTKFRTVKMLFLISPAYVVPQTRTTLREKSSPTKVSDSVPSPRAP